MTSEDAEKILDKLGEIHFKVSEIIEELTSLHGKMAEIMRILDGEPERKLRLVKNDPPSG
jgi:uncharacterized coiled-coil DUF342 family protein